MRFDKVGEMVCLLFIFLKREVLNIGALKKRSFKVFAVVSFLLLIGIMSFGLYMFLDKTNSDVAQTSVVLDAYSCSIFLWTLVIFIFIKLLFMKKGSLIAYTIQMPVSRIEKNVAILLFEIVITLGVVLFLSSSMVIALVLRNGSLFLSRILCNILFNAVTVYFIFELIYDGLDCFCCWLGLEKIKNVMLICFMSLLLITFYVFVIPDVFLDILYTYREKTGTASVLIYMKMTEKYGILPTTLMFILVTSILCLGIIKVPVRDIGKNNYINVFRFRRKNHSVLEAYILAFLRKTDTINYYFIALFIYAISIALKVEYGYYSILILSINSLYAYVQTEDVRYILMQKNYCPKKDYINLIIGQISYITILAIPIVIVNMVVTRDISFIFGVFSLIISSIVLFSMVGIFFPAKNENPFAAMFGIAFILIIGILIIAVSFLMNLDTKHILLFFMGLMGLSIFFSIQGMGRLYKNKIKSGK